MTHQITIFEHMERQSYPDYCGAKVGGASLEAADSMETTKAKNLWLDRCKQLYQIRDNWTAEEGIIYWALKLGEDARSVDKRLRPRFTDLTNTRPAYLFKSGDRRGDNKIKVHVYKLTSCLVGT